MKKIIAQAIDDTLDWAAEHNGGKVDASMAADSVLQAVGQSAEMIAVDSALSSLLYRHGNTLREINHYEDVEKALMVVTVITRRRKRNGGWNGPGNSPQENHPAGKM